MGWQGSEGQWGEEQVECIWPAEMGISQVRSLSPLGGGPAWRKQGKPQLDIWGPIRFKDVKVAYEILGLISYVSFFSELLIYVLYPT